MVKKTKRMKLAESPANYTPQGNALAPTTRSKVKADPNTGMAPFAKSPFPSAAGAVGISISDNAASSQESSAFQTGGKISKDAVGNSGTQVFGGYFSEEYLQELRGREGAKVWDQMRRSEAQIAMLLNAVSNPIKAAEWNIEPFDPSNPDSVRQAEFCEMAIKDMIDWQTFLTESLTVLPFGFSMFEVVHNVVFNHPKFGTINGLKALSFRSQKTIENWQLEQKTGRLLGVNQYTYSDLGGNQFIPGEFLLVFTHSKEGDNYEGISVLRPMYGAYKRKDLYLKLAAIGVEKYAVGTPIGTVPKGKEKTTEYTEFKKVLQNYTSHETAYITKPEGWTIEIQKGDFDADKIKELLVFENTEMANALVANFLALGMNGGGGAYALGSNLGEFFTSGIQSYADLICDGVNRLLFPNLVKLNFGDQAGYPKMKCSGISDKAGKELAEVIKFLADARAIDPDQPLKEFLRKQYKLPKPDPTTAVALPAIPAGASANYAKPGSEAIDPVSGKLESTPAQLAEHAETIKLADKKYVAKFDNHKAELKKLMMDNLPLMYDGLKDALRKKYASLSGSQKILAAKGVDMPGLNNYKKILRDKLTEVATQAIAEARKKVPSKKNIKLSDKFASLPPIVRNLVEAQSSLVAETQAADIEKQVFFQFTSSATTQDDIDAILHDVDESVLPSLEGSTKGGMSLDAAAGDAVAHVTQQGAAAFFFDSDVIDEIESFTFTNEDPVSDICQELAGTTFAANDPDLDRYSPPMHHNCKSRLVPNLKGDSGNPDIDRGGVSLTQKALNSITL
jgi:phage gp29-like protein